MKNLISFVCMLLLAVPSLHAQQTDDITNPVWPHDWPDPTVWKAEDGMYYSLATSGRQLLQSADLKTWQLTEITPIDEQSWEQMHQYGRHFWAPDVTTVAGQRLLYATLYNSAEDSRIGVLKETEPGHFRFVASITHSAETGIDDTIDPEVITDPETGKVWMFFGSIGGVHRVELTADGLAVKPGAQFEHVAGLTVRQNPSRSQVFEGSYLHYRQGYWYLFVSSGNYSNHTYKLQVGRSKSLTGEFLSQEGKPMLEGYATPVLHSDEGDRFYGPGHCGEIFTAADGNEYIFYHCHVQGMEKPSARPMLLSRIQWDKDGWPFVEGGKPQ